MTTNVDLGLNYHQISNSENLSEELNEKIDVSEDMVFFERHVEFPVDSSLRRRRRIIPEHITVRMSSSIRGMTFILTGTNETELDDIVNRIINVRTHIRHNATTFD